MNDARKIKQGLTAMLRRFPWRIEVTDWTGDRYRLGGDEPHWYPHPLVVRFREAAPGLRLLAFDGRGFLEDFLAQRADLAGNLFLLTTIRDHLFMELTWGQTLRHLLHYIPFQSISRAKVNVKSHYDIPEDLTGAYLDQAYHSYSCALFAEPWRMDPEEALRAGTGRDDDWDSLERAQYRKFKDAVDFLKPSAGDTLLDIGCGYGGQLRVALECHPFGKASGWTCSSVQTRLGREYLAAEQPQERWAIHEGDYREDHRIYDHMTSTGMICHVGPRGLIPYVRWVNAHMRPGGRYMHHCMMHNDNIRGTQPRAIGVAFNHDYVWPGFHWFSLSEHVEALQTSGFLIDKLVDLSPHYAKTVFCWYLRLMRIRDRFIRRLGVAQFRTWQVYLAGGAESFRGIRNGVFRIYCTKGKHYYEPALDKEPIHTLGDLYTAGSEWGKGR